MYSQYFSQFQVPFLLPICCKAYPILGDIRLSRNGSRRFFQYSDLRRSSIVPSYYNKTEMTSPNLNRMMMTGATNSSEKQVSKWGNELTVPGICKEHTDTAL